jgi:hypothetical protein
MPPRSSVEAGPSDVERQGCSRVRRWLWAVGKNCLRVTSHSVYYEPTYKIRTDEEIDEFNWST